MAISHAGHNHPATPAGRRACRAGNAAPAPATTKVVNGEIRDLCTDCRKNVVRIGNKLCWACNIKVDAPVRKTVAAPRIQPRRSGARVSAGSSTCIQAALHIDAHGGRCACGWMAAA